MSIRKKEAYEGEKRGEDPILIPRRLLFGDPQRSEPRVSPDGAMFSFLAPYEGRMNIWLADLDLANARPLTEEPGKGIYHHFWTYDSRRILYFQDSAGDENYHLYGVEVASGKIRDFTPFDGVRVKVAGYFRRHPEKLVLAMNRRDSGIYDAFLLDLKTGEIQELERNPGNITWWIPDAECEIRCATRPGNDGSLEVLVRDGRGEAWKSLLKWGFEDRRSSQVLGFTGDGEYLLLLDSRGSDTARLVRSAAGSGFEQILAEHPRYDVDEVILDPDTLEARGVSFQGERAEWLFFEEDLSADFHAFDLERQVVTLCSQDILNSKRIISTSSDTEPVSYFLLDRTAENGNREDFEKIGKNRYEKDGKSGKSGRKPALLFYSQPELKTYRHAAVEPFSLLARDGLQLEGYLTFPFGVERSGLPAVLRVHGGPWERDTWGYNPEAQWLANRGYLVIQVNFRGSAGYGKAFLNAGNREWGGKMQDDLEDACRHVCEKGYADPAGIAIYGCSYGGYAALAAAAFKPGLFSCAASAFGPVDLAALLESMPPYWKLLEDDTFRRIGDPAADREFLLSRSPVAGIDAISIPLLIIHGMNDPRVNREGTMNMVRTLRNRGIPCTYQTFPDEGHSVAKPENRLLFHAIVERFLARYLGGRYEESGIGRTGEKVAAGEDAYPEILKRAIKSAARFVHRHLRRLVGC